LDYKSTPARNRRAVGQYFQNILLGKGKGHTVDALVSHSWLERPKSKQDALLAFGYITLNCFKKKSQTSV